MRVRRCCHAHQREPAATARVHPQRYCAGPRPCRVPTSPGPDCAWTSAGTRVRGGPGQVRAVSVDDGPLCLRTVRRYRTVRYRRTVRGPSNSQGALVSIPVTSGEWAGAPSRTTGPREAPPAGLEPATLRLTVECSAN